LYSRWVYDKMTTKKERIDILLKTQSISEVAKILKIDRSSLTKYFKRLENAKLIENKEGFWIRTDNDENLVELHNLRVSFACNEIHEGYLQIEQNKGNLSYENNSHFKQKLIYIKEIPNFLIRSSNSKLIFQQRKGFQFRLERDNQAIDKLYDLISESILKHLDTLEKKFRITPKNMNEISMEVDSNHIAYVNEHIARKIVSKDESIKVLSNGKERVIVDLSAGKDKPHLEFTDKEYAQPDSKNYEQFFQRFLKGEFNNLVKEKDFLYQLDQFNERALKPFAEQLSVHLPVERSARDYLMKNIDITERMEQQFMKQTEFMEDIKHKLDKENWFEEI